MRTRNKLVQTRPNTLVNFFDATQAFKDLKTTFVGQNKLEDQGASWSANQLTKTWTLVFPTDANYQEFKDHATCIEYFEDMLAHNSSHLISHSIETDEIE